MYTKPVRLKKGDRIAIVSPSWGGPSCFPHIYESGIEALREMGLEPVEFPTARMDAEELHRNPRIRAEDINNAFADRDINGIIATIGGSDSIRILPFLDRDVIMSHPKLLMGYSDTTTLLTLLNSWGMVTFNGPSVMAGFSQLAAHKEVYRKYMSDFLLDKRTVVPGELPSFRYYAEGYLPWADLENRGKLKEIQYDKGWNWLQGTERFTGRLFGGCIEVLEMLKGTDFWPERDFWNGRILFLETSEDKPSVDYVRYALRSLGMMGVFDRIGGILMGRPRDYSPSEKEALDQVLRDVVAGEFGRGKLNIISNLDFGHTDPQIILPLGIEAEIDPDAKSVKLLESPFREDIGK